MIKIGDIIDFKHTTLKWVCGEIVDIYLSGKLLQIYPIGYDSSLTEVKSFIVCQCLYRKCVDTCIGNIYLKPGKKSNVYDIITTNCIELENDKNFYPFTIVDVQYRPNIWVPGLVVENYFDKKFGIKLFNNNNNNLNIEYNENKNENHSNCNNQENNNNQEKNNNNQENNNHDINNSEKMQKYNKVNSLIYVDLENIAIFKTHTGTQK